MRVYMHLCIHISHLFFDQSRRALHVCVSLCFYLCGYISYAIRIFLKWEGGGSRKNKKRTTDRDVFVFMCICLCVRACARACVCV